MSVLLRNIANRCIFTIRSFPTNGVQREKAPAATELKPIVHIKPSEIKPSNLRSQQAVGQISTEDEVKPNTETLRKTHRVNNLEKHFLVWSGRYKSVDEIPTYVAHEAVEKARSRARIRIANLMILSAMFACIGVVYTSKRAVARGESLQQENIEWHRQLKEEHEASVRAASEVAFVEAEDVVAGDDEEAAEAEESGDAEAETQEKNVIVEAEE